MHFAVRNSIYEQQERIWNYKRAVAQTVASGGDPDEPFRQEAEARNMTIQEFAQLILNKDDKTNAFKYRELERQKTILRIESCKTHQELEIIVAETLDTAQS